MQVSVVIPFYNEQDNVGPLVEEVAAAMTDYDFEIVAVDDGSSDQTWTNLTALRLRQPLLRLVRHKGNFGQSAAIVSGVRAAHYPVIATLDGDGQNDPADIPALLQERARQPQDGPVVVVGNRRKRQDVWLRRLSSRVANGVRQRLLRDDCSDTGCGLKTFPRDLFLAVPHFNHMHRFLPALFKRAGAHVINVSVNHRPRTRGVSKYGVGNRLWVGITDLLGVMWLQRRPCLPRVDRDAV